MANNPSALQISTSGAFPQQGQVDWVSFGSTVYSLTAATLQRFSSAGVQPATYAAGIALANRFKLGRLGEKRIIDAVSNLRGIPGFEQVLYFGFGQRSFVKLLAEDPKGSDLVALCSCLGELHSDTVTAWVLRELWIIEGFPDQYRPPHSQFVALAKACAGVLTRSSFSNTVAGMRFHVWDSWNKSTIMVSPAIDIAKVLSGLFSIARGEVESITVIGWDECAFIAGIAQWLFDFTVRVEEGEHLVYTNAPDHVIAQVTVRYDQLNYHQNNMVVTATNYVLRAHTELLIQTPNDSLLRLALRSPWSDCLSRLFGMADFSNKLMQNCRSIGGLLGSMARIYTAVATGEMELESEVWKSKAASNYNYLSEATHGRGFTHTITSTFPELKAESGFQDGLDAAVGATLDIAKRDIEFQLRSLQSLCSCLICNPKKMDYQQRCLVAMAFTLYHLVFIIACVECPPDLYPTLSGLEKVYNHCTFIWGNHSVSSPPIGYQTWEYCLDQLRILSTMQEPAHHRQAGDFNKPVSGPLTCAFLLFVGIWPQQTSSQDYDCCTGICAMGLCFYMDSLRFPSSNAALAQNVHIIPGHIEWQGRSYDTIVDGKYHDSLRPSVPMAEFEDAVNIPPGNMFRDDKVSITSLVAERSTDREIVFYYKVTFLNGTVYIFPGFSALHWRASTGRTQCDNISCPSLPLPCTFIKEGWEVDQGFYDKLHYQNGIACCVWEFQNDLARCATLAVLCGTRQGGARKTTYLARTGECIPCCVRALLLRSWSLTEPATGLKQGVVHIL